MTPYERITIVKAIDDIESARIAMGAMFGKKGNANEWGECAFFCALRDILCTTREQLESYMKLHEQQEKRKKDKVGRKMRLVDADELLEHAWRDKLDSRELIAKMIQDAPTVKEIPTTIPIEIFERLLSSDREHGEWINHYDDLYPAESTIECSVCHEEQYYGIDTNFCPNCGADMRALAHTAKEPTKTGSEDNK